MKAFIEKHGAQAAEVIMSHHTISGYVIADKIEDEMRKHGLLSKKSKLIVTHRSHLGASQHGWDGQRTQEYGRWHQYRLLKGNHQIIEIIQFFEHDIPAIWEAINERLQMDSVS